MNIQDEEKIKEMWETVNKTLENNKSLRDTI